MTIIGNTPYVAPTATMTSKGAVSTPAAGMETLEGSSTTKANGTAFDKDTFLKLLVAQLKFQDPSKPADSSQLMAQTAQLSMVESTNAMSKQIQSMVDTYSSMLAEARMSSAVSLVGHPVEYVDPNNAEKTLTGTVDSVRFDAKGPILKVGGSDVPLVNVTSVSASK